MVLICGHLLEPVTAFLCARLQSLKIDHRILDLELFPRGFDMDWSWNNGIANGCILNRGWSVELDELTGIYFRNVSFSESNSNGDNPEVNEPVYPVTDPNLSALLNSSNARVINRPAAMCSNRSKPFQALTIRRFGLRIPKTLVTNDPDAARDFYERCRGNVIFKSISGVRSIVTQMSGEHFSRLSQLQHCPTQFQEYIPGDNIRVHVIGDRLFAIRIQTDAVDYRYAGEEGYARRMLPTTIPKETATACLQLSQEFGLLMAGIDLKETPAGEYYCFEVNASPAFPFYEEPAHPILTDTLAEFLAGTTN